MAQAPDLCNAPQRLLSNEGNIREIDTMEDGTMTIFEREMKAKQLGGNIRRARSACEYYSLMASITNHIESSHVFMSLASVRHRHLKRVQQEQAELRAA